MSLVEDNDTYRATLELLLGMRDDLDVAASIGSGNEAGIVCASVQPDVVLIDYRLTASVSRNETDELMATGVVTVLKKDEEFGRLLATIRKTGNG